MLALLLICLHAPDARPQTKEPPAPQAPSRLAQFPPPAIAEANYYFATAHLRWLEDRLPLEQDRLDWPDFIKHARYCQERWMALHMVRNNVWMDENGEPCDYWFDQLKELLGEDDFKAGRMPPSAPPWHIRDTDK